MQATDNLAVNIINHDGEDNKQNDNEIEIEINHANSMKIFGCCNCRATTPSAKTIMLQDFKCPSCIRSIWHSFEYFRYILSSLLLMTPFGKCIIGRIGKKGSTLNDYCNAFGRILIFDIIILISFIIFEIFRFHSHFIELSDNVNIFETRDLSDKLRIISLCCARESIVIYALSWTLATRNSFWNLIFGLPLERAIFYHIWFSRYSIMLTWIHFIAFLNYWHVNSDDVGTITDNLQRQRNISGLIAIICCTLLFILSLNYFRRNHWELFLKTHWIFFLFFLFFASKHDVYIFTDTYWIPCAVIVWICDLCYRSYISLNMFYRKSVLISAEMINDEIIKLCIQKRYLKCDGGQYCFICIPEISLTEWHPMSISQHLYDKKSDKDQYVFHIKVLGDWCNTLKSFILSKTDLPSIMVEGPYGKPEIDLHSYSTIILISGGIGITPLQSTFDELIKFLKNGHTNLNRIHFIWIVRNNTENNNIFKLLKEFDDIHWYSITNQNNISYKQEIIIINKQNNNKVVINTDYYVTRCNKDNHQNIINKLQKDYPQINFGRPNITEIIKQAKQNKTNNCNKNIAIMGCGPQKMIDDIRNNAALFNINCHTEVFDF